MASSAATAWGAAQGPQDSLAVVSATPAPTLNETNSIAHIDIAVLASRQLALVKLLQEERTRLLLDNPDGKNNATVNLVDFRLKRLDLFGEAVRSSVDVLDRIVQNQNLSALDVAMETENPVIINKFQNLVLQAKNDHLALVDAKKELDKSIKENEERLQNDQDRLQGEHTGDDVQATATGTDKDTVMASTKEPGMTRAATDAQPTHVVAPSQSNASTSLSNVHEPAITPPAKTLADSSAASQLGHRLGDDASVLATPSTPVADLDTADGTTHADNSTKQAPRKKAPDNIVENVLKDVSNQADKLESGLKGDAFKESQKSADTTVETVLRVDDTTKGKNASGGTNSAETASSVLIDSENNKYVLSRSGDGTAHVEDTRLLNDILLLLVTCFACSLGFYAIGLPSFFGHIMAGAILGPPGYIENAVQVETISRGLGVIFIMFFLGLEFSPSKIKKVWSVSVFGSAALLVVTVSVVVVIGVRLGAAISDAVILGASLFLSSTAVVMHFMKSDEVETVYGRTIMGILISQDVLLGFLIAILPALETSGWSLLFTLVQLFVSAALFLAACFVVYFPAMHLLMWLRPSRAGGSKEIYLLSSVGFCFVIVGIGSLFRQSLEISCFAAGVMISSRKNLAEITMHVAEPLRSMFSALFFASIGLHIYPSFLISTGLLLVTLTAVVMITKVILATFVLKIMFRYPWNTAFTIGIGLCQVSEFTFVFASKAKSAQLMTREMFYLLLGVTTLSLLVSPMLWHLAAWIDGRRGNDAGGLITKIGRTSSPRRSRSGEGFDALLSDH